MTPSGAARPALVCLRCSQARASSLWIRPLSSTTTSQEPSVESSVDSSSSQPPPPPPPDSKPERILDPNKASRRGQEKRLYAQGLHPIGSRRRRAAIATSQNMPFEQLPFACFQEARKILAADREEKLRQIEQERRRIRNLRARDAEDVGGSNRKRAMLGSMLGHLERMKVLADINDPIIKKRFEDGEGDMDKPIYRHYARKKWESYALPLVMQRLTQMNIVPDLLPSIHPTAAVSLFFRSPLTRRGMATPPGTVVPSRISARCPRLDVQVFDRGSRLVSVAVVDADVPNVDTDSFDVRCHFLAVNVRIEPNACQIQPWDMSAEGEDSSGKGEIVLPWLPPHAQKGAPYHRLAIFIMEQPRSDQLESKAALVAGEPAEEALTQLPAAQLRERYAERMGFSVRNFAGRHRLKMVGASMFRSVWDSGTSGVMRVAGLPGAEIEYIKKKGERLPERLRRRGTERFR